MTTGMARNLYSTIAMSIEFVFLLGMVSVSTSAVAQQIEKEVRNRLDSIVMDTANAFDIPGVSVGIVKGRNVVYQKSVGVASIDTQEAVSSATSFRMGSISKVFTATAIMQLHERNLVELHKPVHEYVPYLRLDDQRYKNITVAQLLSHTSGLPGDNKAYRGEPDFSDDAIKKYIVKMGDRALEFDPGEKYSYSNSGYVVLSALVEEVTGSRFEDYVSRNILAPIGMKMSSYDGLDTDGANVAALHVIGADFKNAVHENGPHTRWIVGAGGLSSNVHDMCLFALALLNGGEINGRQILSSDSLEKMWKRGTGTREKGLAWSVYRVWGGRKLVDHGGNSLGFSAEIALMPEEGLGVIVLCNNRNGAEWPLAGALLRTMLGLQVAPTAYSPDHTVQEKLREEGPDAALAYLETVLTESGGEISCHDLMLLAYRIVQGGGESNLETAQAIFELLAEHFPDDSRVNSMLGEVYLKLAVKQYRESIRRNPSDWAGQRMLEQLEKVSLDFY